MSRLDELFPDVSELSTDDLLDLVRNVRKDRKKSKKPAKHTAKQKADAKESLRATLGQLNPEQIKELLGRG